MTTLAKGAMGFGLALMATTSVQAGALTGISFGGTASADYTVYQAGGDSLFKVESNLANAQAALTGNVANPTGNVELASSSELPGFDSTKNTTLFGVIGGQSIALSSLTAADWNSQYKNTGKTLFDYWFDLFCDSACSSSSSAERAQAKSEFLAASGRQQFSGPNISYVNQDDATGLIRIGLAGDLNLSGTSPFTALTSGLLKSSFQASELVKYSYNGITDYLFSFSATNSGLTLSSDGRSFNANYEVTISGLPANGVPEPSTILLLAIGLAGVAATGTRPRLRRTRQ